MQINYTSEWLLKSMVQLQSEFLKQPNLFPDVCLRLHWTPICTTYIKGVSCLHHHGLFQEFGLQLNWSLKCLKPVAQVSDKSIFVHFLMPIVQFKTFHFYMQWFEFIPRVYLGKLFWTFKYHEKPSSVNFGYKSARVRVLLRVHFVLSKTMFNSTLTHTYFRWFTCNWSSTVCQKRKCNKTRLLDA